MFTNEKEIERLLFRRSGVEYKLEEVLDLKGGKVTLRHNKMGTSSNCGKIFNVDMNRFMNSSQVCPCSPFDIGKVHDRIFNLLDDLDFLDREIITLNKSTLPVIRVNGSNLVNNIIIYVPNEFFNPNFNDVMDEIYEDLDDMIDVEPFIFTSLNYTISYRETILEELREYLNNK